MTEQADPKKVAAVRACEFVEDGMTVGLGTGSTAAHMVRRLGERVKEEGLRIRGVPTSEATADLAREVGIPLVEPNDVDVIHVTIDGADEVDPEKRLIKGLGGALLREKVVASLTERQVIIVDASKLVPRLGTKAPLPVEVLPFAWNVVRNRLVDDGYKPELRQRDGEPVLTDNGNHVLDVRFPDGIQDPEELERELNNLPGVLENGFFLGLADTIVEGYDDGSSKVW